MSTLMKSTSFSGTCHHPSRRAWRWGHSRRFQSFLLGSSLNLQVSTSLYFLQFMHSFPSQLCTLWSSGSSTMHRNNSLLWTVWPGAPQWKVHSPLCVFPNGSDLWADLNSCINLDSLHFSYSYLRTCHLFLGFPVSILESLPISPYKNYKQHFLIK